MQAAIATRATELTLPALLYALRALGYEDQDVEFCSHLTSLHQPSLVQSVDFTESPRRATVLLNTGLLATQSPLPGYFLRFLEEHPDSALADLLAFFAHPLLRRMALAQAAELDAFGPSFTPTRLRTLELLGLRSPSTIHWLFQAAFPELSVVVRRGRERVAFPCQSVRLGHTAFGDGSSFGAVAYTLLPGLEVVLHSEEPRCRTGQHWHEEAVRRLADWVLPRLTAVELQLRITLVVQEEEGWLILGEQPQLGLQPLYESDPARRPHSRQLLLFCGDVSLAAIARLQQSLIAPSLGVS